jgi:nickel-dependent lactate racemase
MISMKIPAWEWYGWEPEEISFPSGWQVHEQRMNGHSARALSQSEVAEKLDNPVGTPPLRELARGRKKCAIIIDDMTRPTKTYQMLPTVLGELRQGGLSEDEIVFVMATGAHAGRMASDFKKKLGEEVPRRHLVFNHVCFENCVDIGKTSFGTPVQVNREVMSCDLKVTLGAMMPHFGYGFGGGSKMLLPGVSGIDSISTNHRIMEGTGPGKVEQNKRRLDSEEAARMAGVDFIVNAFLNADCDVADMICGDVVEAHRAGTKIAREHYATQTVENADISIGNCYPMANEGYKAYHIAIESVREGGDLVFLIYTPEGCRVHYYNGRFGTNHGGRGWRPDVYVKKPWKMERVLAICPSHIKSDEAYYGEGSTWLQSWQKAREMLEQTHGSEASVALYPCAAMQVSKRNAQQT